jgi:hypothetical protein
VNAYVLPKLSIAIGTGASRGIEVPI